MKTFYALLIAVLLAVPSLAFAGTNGPSPVPNPPNFQISTTTTTLCKGQLNYIPVTVTNKGSAVSLDAQMQNVQLGITDTSYLHTLLNGSANAGTINNNTDASTYIPVFVSSNASTIINVEFNINYYYYLYYSDSETRNMSFGVRTCPSQLVVNVPSKELVSGEIQGLGLDLLNNGIIPLRNISVYISVPQVDGAVLVSQPTQINLIPANDYVALNESVYILRNASQTFPVNITIDFYNESMLGQVSNQETFLSSGVIDINPSSITVSPESPSPGSIFSASFVLTDVGTASASAVTATALPGTGISSFGSNFTFVGDMAVDSQTPVTLTLQASNKLADGNYTIPVKITYLNALRQSMNTLIYIPIQISANASAANGTKYAVRSGAGKHGGGLFVLLLIVIVVVLVVLLYRERRLRRKK